MQDVFTKGMNRWFALKEFQVGVPTEDIDQRSSFEELQSKINKVGSLSTTVGRALNLYPMPAELKEALLRRGHWEVCLEE